MTSVPLRYQRAWGFGLAITIVYSGNNYFHYHSPMTVSLVWACYPLSESNLWDGCPESPLHLYRLYFRNTYLLLMRQGCKGYDFGDFGDFGSIEFRGPSAKVLSYELEIRNSYVSTRVSNRTRATTRREGLGKRLTNCGFVPSG